MPLITLKEGSGYTGDIEPGTYPATLVGLEEDTFYVDGETRPVFKWRFALDDGTELEGVTSQLTTPTTKLVKWLTALVGPEAVRVGQSFEVADLMGREALVNIQPNKNGYPRVEDVLAKPKQAARARPVKGEAEAVDAF